MGFGQGCNPVEDAKEWPKLVMLRCYPPLFRHHLISRRKRWASTLARYVTLCHMSCVSLSGDAPAAS
eukprot:6457302-Amphidinium_carterae.1